MARKHTPGNRLSDADIIERARTGNHELTTWQAKRLVQLLDDTCVRAGR